MALRLRPFTLCLGVVVAAACSFNTDGVTFQPDDEFNAGAGRKPGAGAGPIGDAGDQGDAGDGSVAGTGTGGSAHGGANNGGKGGGKPGGGSGGDIVTGGAGGAGGSVGTGGGVSHGGTGGIVGMGGGVVVAGAGGGPSGKTYPCMGSKPGEKLLADFENVSSPMDQWKDGNGTVFSAYAFPDPASGNPRFDIKGALSVQASNLTMPMGGGIRMMPCIDLTGAYGLAFDVTGYFSQAIGPQVAMRIVTNQSLIADDTLREGTCLPKPGQDPHLYCESPHVDFGLKAGTVTLQFKFSEFSGGKPQDTPNLDQIKRIEWVLTTTTTTKPYDATFTIDNIYVTY